MIGDSRNRASRQINSNRSNNLIGIDSWAAIQKQGRNNDQLDNTWAKTAEFAHLLFCGPALPLVKLLLMPEPRRWLKSMLSIFTTWLYWAFSAFHTSISICVLREWRELAGWYQPHPAEWSLWPKTLLTKHTGCVPVKLGRSINTSLVQDLKEGHRTLTICISWSAFVSKKQIVTEKYC